MRDCQMYRTHDVASRGTSFVWLERPTSMSLISQPLGENDCLEECAAVFIVPPLLVFEPLMHDRMACIGGRRAISWKTGAQVYSA
jgi:hypothetical protein